LERGAYLKVFNAKTSFEELEEFKPNGYFISNGPGGLLFFVNHLPLPVIGSPKILEILVLGPV
jgi:hypothetical protein